MRKINRAVKIRIYPNAEQRVQIEKTIGCSRFIYNCMLADKIEHYKKEKKMLRNTPASYKKEYPWLKEPDIRCSTGIQRKSLHGNSGNCPDVREAVGIMKNRRNGLHCVMKKSEIREKISSINSVQVLQRTTMQYAWKTWI